MRNEERYLLAGMVKICELPIAVVVLMKVMIGIGNGELNDGPSLSEILISYSTSYVFIHYAIKHFILKKIIDMHKVDETLGLGATLIWSGFGGITMVWRYCWTMFRRIFNRKYRKNFLESYYYNENLVS